MTVKKNDLLALARDLAKLAPHKNIAIAPDIESHFEQLVTDPEIKKATARLFHDGHFARAVEAAFKCLNNKVKKLSNSQLDGATLMRTVFSIKKPILKINELKTLSEKNEQNGYMDIFAGSMTGIRNPRAHEHELEDHPEYALELILLANHLIRTAMKSNRD